LSTYPLQSLESRAIFRASSPDGEESSGNMFVKVASMASISEALLSMKRLRIEGVERDVGFARTCCTFFAPANWVKIVGHLMAFERSIWNRASHAESFG